MVSSWWSASATTSLDKIGPGQPQLGWIIRGDQLQDASARHLAELALIAVRRERLSTQQPERLRGLPHVGMPEIADNPLAQAVLRNGVSAQVAFDAPLLDPQRRLAVLFSPRSGCTSISIWFFRLIGQVRAARDFDPWPHNYRNLVYYRSALYFRALFDDLASYRWIRIVRDTYERAASSFRHALATGYADKRIAKALAGHSTAQHGLSFGEFLDFLETEDLRACNLHHGLQVHPVEELVRPRYLIDISRDDMFERLGAIEGELGLPKTDFTTLGWLHDSAAARKVEIGEFADAYGTRFTREQAVRGPWPAPQALLTARARKRIAQLYAQDLERYGRTPQK